MKTLIQLNTIVFSHIEMLSDRYIVVSQDKIFVDLLKMDS